MNRQETTLVITFLAGNYNSIAEKNKAQKELMINTWQECLSDLEYNLVMQAVKKSILENPFPPTIHDVRKNAVEIMNPPNMQKTAIEAWEEAYSMICNGGYMTQEEFEKHSSEVKKFFGNVRQVKELALTDLKTVNTVTKGQFLKQYDLLIERQKQENLLPKKFKEQLEKIGNIKKLEEKKT